MPESIKILVVSGSERSGSVNKKLASAVATSLEAKGAKTTQINLRDDLAMPIYDGDIETKHGVPEAAKKLHELFRSHNGVFIASPEYNSSLSPLLLNSIAWISRISDNGGIGTAFRNQTFALGSASPGPLGGYRGLMSLRCILDLQFGADVILSMIVVNNAADAFDDANKLKAPYLQQSLEKVTAQLVQESSKRAK